MVESRIENPNPNTIIKPVKRAVIPIAHLVIMLFFSQSTSVYLIKFVFNNNVMLQITTLGFISMAGLLEVSIYTSVLEMVQN